MKFVVREKKGAFRGLKQSEMPDIILGASLGS